MVWLALASVLVATACGAEQGPVTGVASAPETPSTTGVLAPGEEVYAITCAPCHGEDGRGVPGLGSSLIGGEFAEGSDDDARRAIIEGEDATDPRNVTGVAMPPLGGNPRITDAQVEDVIAYLRGLQP